MGRALAIGIVGSVLLAIPSQVRPQSAAPDEYQVKLAYLYNFTKFVDWPAGVFSTPNSPLVIGIVGTDPFARELENELSTRNTGGHPIVIRRLRPDSDFASCHVLFVRPEVRRYLAAILARLKGHEVLTVGEMPGFLDLGGDVNFTFARKSVAFEVNLAAIRQNQFRLRSNVLALACKVVGR